MLGHSFSLGCWVLSNGIGVFWSHFILRVRDRNMWGRVLLERVLLGEFFWNHFVVFWNHCVVFIFWGQGQNMGQNLGVLFAGFPAIHTFLCLLYNQMLVLNNVSSFLCLNCWSKFGKFIWQQHVHFFDISFLHRQFLQYTLPNIFLEFWLWKWFFCYFQKTILFKCWEFKVLSIKPKKLLSFLYFFGCCKE